MQNPHDADRMDAGTAQIGDGQSASQTAGGTIFADGQTIVLNGNNCVIESLVIIGFRLVRSSAD